MNPRSSQVAESPNAWRKVVKRRLAVATAGCLLWSVAIEARLVYLQVIRHEDMSARAERQQMRTIEAPAKRGEILDRRGRVLAYSVDADTIYAVPTEIADPDRAARTLCGALEDCSAKDREALAERIRKGRAFAYVRRQVTPEQARRVAALDLEGIGFMKESRRFYPAKDLAAHVLGYVGIDNAGLGGIESTYDSLIKGRPGTVLIQTDARRHAFSRIDRPPTAGAALELTIDQYLQHIAERELKEGVQKARASSGSAIIMDPWTGEVLALANYPTFNPNTYRQFREERRRNRAIQDLYEPGSTFKIVTASAALEQKLVRPGDLIDARGGSIRFGSRVINDTHDYGVMSFTDVIVKSSNVGAIRVGLKLGPERLTEYVRKFGFGRRTSPDFPGETAGIVWDAAKLNDSALASVSMGYQVGVTPLQMAAAASAVANGGELVQPRVVRAVIRDGTRVPVPRKVVGRVISAGTAAELVSIMEGVVTDGTAKAAQIGGYTVAGKTGTAKKLVGGSYRGHSDYNVSFVGFAPAREPAFTVIVVVDSPRAMTAYGGVVAAPIFQRITEAALRHYGVAPTLNAQPPVLVVRRDESRERAAVETAVSKSVLTLAAARDGDASLVPDLTGASAREAISTLGRLGLTVRVHGSGIVAKQQPEPGTPLEARGSATLWLERQMPDRESD